MTAVDVTAWADRAMALIRDDIAAGQVPADIGTFSAIHDFVDANQYVDETAPAGCDLAGDAWLAACNAVSDELNRRLQAAHNQGGNTVNEQQPMLNTDGTDTAVELTVADIDEWLAMVNDANPPGSDGYAGGMYPHGPYRRALGALIGQELPHRRYLNSELRVLLARARKALAGS